MILQKYLKPSAIKQKYQSIGWTPQQIGYLLNLKLVDGIKLEDSCLVNCDEVFEFWKISQQKQLTSNLKLK